VRDRAGTLGDVVLGCDSRAGYGANPAYFGALVGRSANRIAYGRFTLDGHLHRLTINDGSHHLHGGHRGFDKALWQGESFEETRGTGVAFRHTSPHGDEGYPGTLTARVRYILTEDDRLIVEYEATTDAPTLVNLTQHSYFNLAGAGSGDILGHELMIAADAFTPVDETLIPTGEISAVAGTPFDFRTPTAIGARIGDPHPQLDAAGGYDHNFVLRRGQSGGEPVLAARVVEPTTGRTLEVFTTEPGLQFYSGNFLDGSITGKGGHAYGHRAGFCLEAQGFPNAPNEPRFPSTVLRPGEVYRSQTVYAFGVSAGRT
jgi:aldose 1-epimerase